MDYTEIVESKNGEVAWEELQKGEFDLIISDWSMPKLSGIELLEKVRNDDKLKSLPFVLLTAESETTQVQEALQKGVDNFIVKPFSMETLRTKLEQTYKKVRAA